MGGSFVPFRNDMTIAGLDSPEWCQQLLSVYGQNPFGEPIFRVVWAPRRITCYGGYWNDTGVFEYRYVPRYGSKKCFLLEKWLPAKFYGNPKEWAARTGNSEGYLSLGAWPKFGVYECCYLFAGPDHSFVPLLPDLVALTAKGIWAGRIRTTSDIRQSLMSAEEFEEQKKDEALSDLWDETHGVRRGMSFGSRGVVQNNYAEIEAYKAKLASAPIKVQKDLFKPGFSQY